MGTTPIIGKYSYFQAERLPQTAVFWGVTLGFLEKLVVGFDEVYVAYPEGLGQNQQGFHRWVSFPVLKTACWLKFARSATASWGKTTVSAFGRNSTHEFPYPCC